MRECLRTVPLFAIYVEHVLAEYGVAIFATVEKHVEDDHVDRAVRAVGAIV